jgi:PLP dependent protein
VSSVGSPDVGARDPRRTELARSLAVVHERIAAACADVGRSPQDVNLVVVTKTFPAADVIHLAALGVTDVGENRDQEAATKVVQVAADAVPGVAPVRWHFIGQLQRNKAASVARYADVVQSVDRPGLVRALANGATSAGRVVDVLLQVDLDEPVRSGRGGAAPGELAALADQVAETGVLRLRGVMAVAPLGRDPRPAFRRLEQLGAGLRASHPQATWVSAGMSGDLEAALACGATHLRVGSAVLGSRPSLR